MSLTVDELRLRASARLVGDRSVGARAALDEAAQLLVVAVTDDRHRFDAFKR